MYSGGSYSEFGYCEHDGALLDTSDFVAFLADPASPRCVLLEIDAWSKSGAVQETLYFSTHGFKSAAADTPAYTYYDACIAGMPVVDRQIAGRDGVGGLTSVYAEISLNNRGGELDDLLTDYALDGRQARILLGRKDDPRSAFGVFFTGVFQSAPVGDKLVARLSDGAAKLRRLVNAAVYLGTGGLEGGTDLKGKNKPVALGPSLNVPAPLVDSTKLIYQVHDGQINDVPAARDRGIALTKGADYTDTTDMNANAPTAGQYRVCKTAGFVRLGSTPSGLMTFDVQGDAAISYITTAAEIVRRILTARVGLNSSEIEPASFARLAVDAPAAVGDWYGTSPVTCAQAIDGLLYGIGAFGGFSRQGAFSVGRVASAAGAVEAASYDTVEIVSVQRQTLPAPMEPIVWRVGVGWQRNYAVQTDLAGGVTAAIRTFCAEPIRVSSDEDAGIQTLHPLARELGPIEGLYALEADAQTERDRLFALWGVDRGFYKVTAKLPALLRDVGDVVEITFPRHGFAAGVPARVLGHRVEGSRVQMDVLV